MGTAYKYTKEKLEKASKSSKNYVEVVHNNDMVYNLFVEKFFEKWIHYVDNIMTNEFASVV